MCMDTGQVTVIEKQKRGSAIDILVDGAVWATVHRDVIFACGVRRGDQATPALLERLQAAEAAHRAHEAALLLISYRPRSEGELRQRLRRRALPEPAIAEAIERLRRSGPVNDEAFAKAWIESRGRGAHGRGTSLLASELRTKGVAP